MKESLKKQLADFKSNKNRILGRLFKRSYQFMSEIATDYLHSRGYKGFRVGHLVLLIHIDLEGTMVNTLAQRAGVTKQAMSKLVQDLQEFGYVETVKNPSDARAILVKITEEGAKFILEWQGCSQFIDAKMQEILGGEKLEKMKDTLEELVDYYEAHSTKSHEFIKDLMIENRKI